MGSYEAYLRGNVCLNPKKTKLTHPITLHTSNRRINLLVYKLYDFYKTHVIDRSGRKFSINKYKNNRLPRGWYKFVSNG